MKRGEFFTPCRDCIMHVGGGCAEGRGNTQDEDGCIVTYFYDCNINEPMPTVPKRFVKYSEPLTAKKLMAGGYSKRHENEAVANFEKVIDDICVYVDFRTRIKKIDIKSEVLFEGGGNKINMRVDKITVGEFNNALALVGFDQFKI